MPSNHSSVETLKEKKMSWKKVVVKSISCLLGENDKSSQKSGSEQTNKNEASPHITTVIINHPTPLQSNPESSLPSDIPLLNRLAASGYGQIEIPAIVETPEKVKNPEEFENPHKVVVPCQVEGPGQIGNPVQNSNNENVRVSNQVRGLGQFGDPGQVEHLGKIENQGLNANCQNAGEPVKTGTPGQISNSEKIVAPGQTCKRQIFQIEEHARKQDCHLVQSGENMVLSYSSVPKPKPVVLEDDLPYQFYSVSSGFVHFKVRAANDAHIALARSLQESGPKIEIFIGGWGNSKSSISRKRTTPSIPLTKSVEVETPGILHRTEFRGFWVRWDGGIISAGHEDVAVPFISWADPEPFPICHVGYRTAWGVIGTWKIEDCAEFNTSPKQGYVFEPCFAGSAEFEYRGPHSCQVCLSTAPAEIDPIYEIILGSCENTRSEIRYNKHKPGKVTVPTPGLLSPYEFRKFSVEWRRGRVLVRTCGAAVMEWTDPAPFPITHFGVRTAGGDCRIKHFPTYWNVLQPLA